MYNRFIVLNIQVKACGLLVQKQNINNETMNNYTLRFRYSVYEHF